MSYGPNITLARLFRKTSEKGSTYFRGRVGLANVALLKSREVADDGGEIWELVISEAPKRAQEPRQPSRSPSPDAAAENGRPAPSQAAAWLDWQRPNNPIDALDLDLPDIPGLDTF